MTIKDLKKIVEGMNDNAEIYCGCEVGKNKFKITGCEHPVGKKEKWDYLKLEYE